VAVAVIVIVAGPVVVAVHVHGNATVGVIEGVKKLRPGRLSLISTWNAAGFRLDTGRAVAADRSFDPEACA